jgi:hypothetical protein
MKKKIVHMIVVNLYNFSRMNFPNYETIDVQKEQEFWNSIIDRTTQ